MDSWALAAGIEAVARRAAVIAAARGRCFGMVWAFLVLGTFLVPVAEDAIAYTRGFGGLGRYTPGRRGCQERHGSTDN